MIVAITTLIPMKRSRKKRRIGAMTAIIGEGDAMIIGALPTIVADRQGPVRTAVLTNHGTNAIMRKALRMKEA